MEERKLHWGISQAALNTRVSLDDYPTYAAFEVAYKEEWEKHFREAIEEFDNDPLENSDVVKAAVAMFDGSGGGIGELKRAIRGLQAGQRTGRHLTAQELAIVRLAFPSVHGILGEEHLQKALDVLESQGRNWAEELEL